MKTFFTALVASFFLFLSFASAEGGFDSMDSRTQFETSGGLSYNAYNGTNWSASASGYHYFAPQFGFGGIVELSRFSGSSEGTFYGIGPAAEYFLPVGERGHVFGQLAFTVGGSEKGSSILSLTPRLGYRYFISEDIAFSLRLAQSFRKVNLPGYQTQAGDLNLQWGFSLFF